MNTKIIISLFIMMNFSLYIAQANIPDKKIIERNDENNIIIDQNNNVISFTYQGKVIPGDQISETENGDFTMNGQIIDSKLKSIFIIFYTYQLLENNNSSLIQSIEKMIIWKENKPFTNQGIIPNGAILGHITRFIDRILNLGKYNIINQNTKENYIGFVYDNIGALQKVLISEHNNFLKEAQNHKDQPKNNAIEELLKNNKELQNFLHELIKAKIYDLIEPNVYITTDRDFLKPIVIGYLSYLFDQNSNAQTIAQPAVAVPIQSATQPSLPIADLSTINTIVKNALSLATKL